MESSGAKMAVDRDHKRVQETSGVLLTLIDASTHLRHVYYGRPAVAGSFPRLRQTLIHSSNINSQTDYDYVPRLITNING